jgi:hypothetical protein
MMTSSDVAVIVDLGLCWSVRRRCCGAHDDVV